MLFRGEKTETEDKSPIPAMLLVAERLCWRLASEGRSTVATPEVTVG